MNETATFDSAAGAGREQRQARGYLAVKLVLIATAFLTRVPVPLVAGAGDVGGAARWFPLIGGAIGGAGALIAWAMRDLISLPAGLTATLVVGLGAWVTGAIHLDGLADMADGFGGGRTRDEVRGVFASVGQRI
jgi:adenosylcobinamide-GDP ribazoletransferase